MNKLIIIIDIPKDIPLFFIWLYMMFLAEYSI